MSLREVLLDELKDLYSAENQLVKALPKTARATNSPELKQIFLSHLDETKGQVERLKQVFEILGKKPTGKHCSGMEGAIAEVKEALEEDSEGAVFDCGIVGGASSRGALRDRRLLRRHLYRQARSAKPRSSAFSPRPSPRSRTPVSRS